MNIRIIRLALLLSGLPFLSGCFTYRAIQSAKNPNGVVLPDRVCVQKAVVSNDNQLLIFLEGSITNSPKNSRFTLAISLAEMEARYNVDPSPDTNGIYRAHMYVQRNAIRAGWPEEINTNDTEIVPIGAPIFPPLVYPDSFAPITIGEMARPLANSNRVLYQVLLGDRMQFVYIDASDKRAYTEIEVPAAWHTPKEEPGYYFLLPVTVPLDIATSPIQVPLIIFVLYSFGHSGC